MKARFDVKQQPVKIVENNDEAYVFICLNEEEKEETITYIIYPEEPEDTSDDVAPGFSYEYDYNEFHDKKDNLDLDDIQANPENYLDYSPSQKTEESNLEEDFNSLKAQFDEMKEAIERGLSL